MRHLLAGAPKYAASGPFDPLTSIAWARALWAEDPSWTNPGNGNGVSSWRNAGSQGGNATQANSTKQPTYRSAYSLLNSQPALEFDGGDVIMLAGLSSLTQPNHIYIVGYQGSTGASDQTLHDWGGNGGRHLLRLRTGGTLQMYAGASATPGTAISAASFQVAAYFNTSASAIRVNGQNHTSLNVGAQGLEETGIGQDAGGVGYFTGAVAFVGIKNAALTSGELSDLSAWAVTKYGVPAL